METTNYSFYPINISKTSYFVFSKDLNVKFIILVFFGIEKMI